MADGSVKIDITVDDSDAKKSLDDIEDKAKETGDGLEDLGDKADKGGKGLGLLDVAAGNLVAGGISGLISGLGDAITSLVNLAEETREFREDMAKLETAFKTAGHSTEDAKAVYEDFYAILGESDRSVEAVNHLAELTDNTEELSKWSTIAAGVTAKFGDSLPIEGLTEAANETAKVGQVTGPLADALNWAGISEDKFNEALKKCSSEQERATLITNTLSGEYAEAAAEYNTLTASTQAARRATAEMEEAQARMGAAIEPFATGLTSLKAGLMDFGATILENVVGAFTTAKDSVSFLSAEQVNLVNTMLATGEQMREMKLAADEAALGIASQYNYVQSLASELFTLADANGQVMEADRARVEFILGELNEALGTEYTMTGDIISNYSSLKDSIYGVIEAKKAQILLAEYEQVYADAIKNVSEQERARATQAIELGSAREAFESETFREKQLRAEAEKSLLEDSSRANATHWANVLESQANATTEAKNLLEEKQAKYLETDQAVQESTLAISTYEQASTLILQGETDKALKLLDDYGNGFLNAAADVDKSKKAEIETLKQKVVETSTHLGLLEAEYKANQQNMTTEQKKEMEKRIEQARKEAQDAMTEAKTIGGNLIEGIVQGANGKELTLTGALKRIVEKGIQAAKDAAGIKSPSRDMRDEVGKMLSLGLAEGVEENRKVAIETMEALTDEVLDVAKKETSEEVKLLEKHNEDIKTLYDEKVDDIAKREKELQKAYESQNKELQKTYEKDSKERQKTYEKENKALQNQRNKYNAKTIDAKKDALKEQYDQDKEALKEQFDLNKEALKEQFDLNKEALKDQYDLDKEALSKEKENAKKECDIQKKANDDSRKLAQEKEKILSEGVKKFETFISALQKIESEYSTAVAAVREKRDSDIASAWDSYNSALDSRISGIKNELKLFEEAEKGEKVYFWQLTDSLESQISVLEDYNKALEKLESRRVNGIFIEELKAMGIDALPELETLNRMTDKQLSNYVKLWEKKNELARKAATTELSEMKENTVLEVEMLKQEASNKLTELRVEYEEGILNLAQELGEGMKEVGDAGLSALGDQIIDYVNIGSQLMEGIAEGMSYNRSSVIQEVVDGVVAAIEAAKEAAGIHSPSTVMKNEVGKNLGLGLAEGWGAEVDKIKKTMAADISNITDNVRATVTAENARFGHNVGTTDTGFSEIARAVGLQSAGINSLASEFRKGSGTTRPIIIELDGRELGRAFVDVGGSETIRRGAKISVGGGSK